MHDQPVLFKKVARGKGRDFVVGDIHGTFDLLYQGLEQLRFDPDADRLFSVGDLVDRGLDNAHASDFLKLDWVHAVRGNHEQMLLSLYETEDTDEDDIREFAEPWWWAMPLTDRRDMLNAFAALPIAIELETRRGRVGILHAEVPNGMSWADFSRRIQNGDEEVIDSALWGRERIKYRNPRGVPGIDHVFVGHTTFFGAECVLGNCIYLDTGAVYGALGTADKGRLTIIEIA